jgi:hypothetical protein
VYEDFVIDKTSRFNTSETYYIPKLNDSTTYPTNYASKYDRCFLVLAYAPDSGISKANVHYTCNDYDILTFVWGGTSPDDLGVEPQFNTNIGFTTPPPAGTKPIGAYSFSNDGSIPISGTLDYATGESGDFHYAYVDVWATVIPDDNASGSSHGDAEFYVKSLYAGADNSGSYSGYLSAGNLGLTSGYSGYVCMHFIVWSDDVSDYIEDATMVHFDYDN